MQACGVQLPPSDFTPIQRMSFPSLRTSALRASHIRRQLTSLRTSPSRTTLIDCSPSHTLHPSTGAGTSVGLGTSIYQTTQRIRWVVAIAQDWFAIKLGYHMSSGFLQIWRNGEKSPRVVMHYRHDWIMWGCCTDWDWDWDRELELGLGRERRGKGAWYFLLTEDNPNPIQ